jgi:hypothetical protein
LAFKARGTVAKSEMYRQYAQECVKIANNFTSPEIRICLIQMAQGWHRLAQDQERADAFLAKKEKSVPVKTRG